jgi:hypothetical protein
MSIRKKRALAYITIILSSAAALNLTKDIIRLNQTDRRLVTARTELETALEEKERLLTQLRMVDNDFWRESQTRNVLKMARPEEVIVVVPENIARPAKIEAVTTAKNTAVNNLAKWRQVFGF